VADVHAAADLDLGETEAMAGGELHRPGGDGFRRRQEVRGLRAAGQVGVDVAQSSWGHPPSVRNRTAASASAGSRPKGVGRPHGRQGLAALLGEGDEAGQVDGVCQRGQRAEDRVAAGGFDPVGLADDQQLLQQQVGLVADGPLAGRIDQAAPRKIR
jgi:hypothetical protein